VLSEVIEFKVDFLSEKNHTFVLNPAGASYILVILRGQKTLGSFCSVDWGIGDPLRPLNFILQVNTMKIDPYNTQARYLKWKAQGSVKGVSKFNAKMLLEYLEDMETGFNVAGRGSLSYVRLATLRYRLRFMMECLENLYRKDRIIDITDREIVGFFRSMRDGVILKKNGTRYSSVPDYAAVFKAFWHWYQRVEGEKGNTIKDITRYVDMNPIKDTEFVYFTVDELRKMAEQALPRYKAMLWFLFDTGIRAPTELANVQVSDIKRLESGDSLQLTIKDESSKTFGRTIKLLLCSDILEKYMRDAGLSGTDYLFSVCPRVINQYLKRLGSKVLGTNRSLGGKRFCDLTMYDFRHSSACYWLPRYKSESALKYRFGWKKDDMIHHYTKLLGMKDTISEDDLLLDSEGKIKIQKELEKTSRERDMLEEQTDLQQSELEGLKCRLEKVEKQNMLLNEMFQKVIKAGNKDAITEPFQNEKLFEKLVEVRVG